MSPSDLTIGTSSFIWGKRTYIMGIINLTDDSFSGDGLSVDIEAAIELALEFQRDGADIIDIGAQSTRPPGTTYGAGAPPVPLAQEIERTTNVISLLAPQLTIPISIDTFRSEVARSAVIAGASLVNDIWALKGDPNMGTTVSDLDVPIILMHNQTHSRYTHFTTDLITSLTRTLDNAVGKGINHDSIILDPGFGFGKTTEHNLEAIRNIGLFRRKLGRPILIGPSRKSTIGAVMGALPPDDRLEGTAATVAISIANGADIVRVHDVRWMKRVAQMTDALIRGWAHGDV